MWWCFRLLAVLIEILCNWLWQEFKKLWRWVLFVRLSTSAMHGFNIFVQTRRRWQRHETRYKARFLILCCTLYMKTIASASTNTGVLLHAKTRCACAFGVIGHMASRVKDARFFSIIIVDVSNNPCAIANCHRWKKSPWSRYAAWLGRNFRTHVKIL